MLNEVVYIHYGHDRFLDPDPIRNQDYYFTKPKGGLWASRKDDESGWKNWCEKEEFRLDSFDRSFEFKLKDSARILMLDRLDQLDDLPKINNADHPYIKGDTFSECCLDFEKLAQEYDAIELTNVGVFYWALYGWDCNSILIMNPNIVEIMDN